VSGAGKEAMDELFNSDQGGVHRREIEPKKFPSASAFNIIPQIDVFMEDGYTRPWPPCRRPTPTVGRDHDALDPGLVVQRLQRDTSWAVEQLGLAMMPACGNPRPRRH